MGKTLLLADDSVTMQKVVGITFANEDIDLVTVDNGDAALERARDIRPDVVLADVGMPGLNGYELCAALKAEPTLQHVKVILLTGTFDTYDEARAREVGADAHVSKPFEAQALVDQVHTLLAQATATTRAAPARPAPAAAAAPPRPEAPASPRREPMPPAIEEPPPLDLDGMDFDDPAGSTVPDAPQFDFDTGIDDLPAPTRAARSAQPAFDQDLQQTAFLDPRESDFAPDLHLPEASHEPEPSAPPEMQTTLLDPAEAPDLFSSGGDPFAAADLEPPDLASSGVFGESSEPALEADASDTGLVPDLTPPDIDPWDAPGAASESLSSESFSSGGFESPSIDGEPPAFDAPADLMEDEEDLELSPAEELPWADPDAVDPDEEPNTPGFAQTPAPRSAPAPVEPPSSRPRPRAHSPQPGPAARSADSVPIDPALLRQAIEKVAWEAFGPLSEQIVREVVKKVEAIAWEALPQIAERLVREEIARLREPS